MHKGHWCTIADSIAALQLLSASGTMRCSCCRYRRHGVERARANGIDGIWPLSAFRTLDAHSSSALSPCPPSYATSR